MINRVYLDSLPSQPNIFNVNLGVGERVVFTAKLKMFGTEKGELLGTGANLKFTLTNHTLFAQNPYGIWTADLYDDVVSFVLDDRSVLFIRNVFFPVTLNKEIIFANGTRRLRGFQFYFNKKDTERLNLIIKGIMYTL